MTVKITDLKKERCGEYIRLRSFLAVMSLMARYKRSGELPCRLFDGFCPHGSRTNPDTEITVKSPVYDHELHGLGMAGKTEKFIVFPFEMAVNPGL